MMWNEAVLAFFEVLSRLLPEEAGTLRKTSLIITGLRLRFEPWTS
jgi:hypothetical protein